MDGEKEYQWRLGEILVQNRWITWDQLEKALEIQQVSNQSGMADILLDRGVITRKQAQVLNLGEILIRNGWVDWMQLREGLAIQRKSGRILGEILVENGFATSENLYRALAIQFKKAFVDFKKTEVSAEAIQLVPKRLAYEYRTLPLLKKDNVLLIAISDPKDLRAESEIAKAVHGLEVRSAVAVPEDIDRAIVKYYGSE